MEQLGALVVRGIQPQSRSSLLYSAVLKVAIDDYATGRLAWSYFTSRDFELACHFAEVNADTVRRAARTFTAGRKAKAKREARYKERRTRKGGR